MNFGELQLVSWKPVLPFLPPRKINFYVNLSLRTCECKFCLFQTLNFPASENRKLDYHLSRVGEMFDVSQVKGSTFTLKRTEKFAHISNNIDTSKNKLVHLFACPLARLLDRMKINKSLLFTSSFANHLF